jgi:23S rRNA (cytosine1962-C5)-methyltransferase
MTIAGRVYLRKGRDGPVRSGNPWIFSQAIARLEPPELLPGDGVEILDTQGDVLGIGYYNSGTTIAVRMLGFGPRLSPDGIVEHRLADALRLRSRTVAPDTNCYRLLNGDGDGLSGVVVDRYHDVVVLQLLTNGADRMRPEIVSGLQALLAPRAILERSHGAVRRQEGLGDRDGLLAGAAVGETTVVENGIKLIVDLERGQKTGYFLDQRENRLTVGRLARGLRVLDLCCYSGGFLLAALAGGAAAVTGVDTSVRALEWARRNLEVNGYAAGSYDLVRSDAESYLAAGAAQFDLVVLDPPPLARSLKDVARASRQYMELNALAMRAVAPGGSLMTFSCSTHFHGEDFVRAVRSAQARASRHFRIIAHLGPGPDHPVLMGHPEGEYLSGLLITDFGYR